MAESICLENFTIFTSINLLSHIPILRRTCDLVMWNTSRPKWLVTLLSMSGNLFFLVAIVYSAVAMLQPRFWSAVGPSFAHGSDRMRHAPWWIKLQRYFAYLKWPSRQIASARHRNKKSAALLHSTWLSCLAAQASYNYTTRGCYLFKQFIVLTVLFCFKSFYPQWDIKRLGPTFFPFFWL